MPSLAYAAWSTKRRQRIDQLFTAHQKVRGSGPGRRWNTEQLNWALVLRLSAEFQGYARELNDLAWDHIMSTCSIPLPQVEAVIQSRIAANRKLDTGNATPSNLAEDFKKLGIPKLWDVLKQVDNRAPDWNKLLELLNTARNGFAHADEVKVAALKAQGHSINLRKIKKWLRELDELASALDDVVRGYLITLTGTAPW
ncbi:HEPN domain-containing protein [Streptomyces sp. GXMU-J15]|uniref:HEPN domain-containing protein n=1 Tax=Streptomyces fuscus TaxID=3048495 RepID=A0ABT7ISI0_9ACTN|nr:HEPN domain-containing protein [Streptomyces fuscus]MDL2075543.1 HEPN domain-containing protein [Streptomyces fuscus]